MNLEGFNFSGKRVLVTGASRGIGLGVARGFANARARLSIIGTNEKVHETADQLRAETGADVDGIICDIADRDAVRKAFEDLEPLDVLVNNAGYERLTPILDPDDNVETTFKRIVDINILGTYYVTREAVKKMKSGSSIVITASVWGKTGMGGFSAYCATKHANIGFMRSLADELGPHGINVNCIAPGYIMSSRKVSEGMGQGGSAETEQIALGRLGTPEDCARVVEFLCTDLSDYVTGQCISVCGGIVI